MPIVVTPTYQGQKTRLTGEYLREAALVVTGLTAAAANTIAHGLPGTPVDVNYVPTSGTPGFETSVPDATNLYYTTGAGQTSLRVFVKY